MNNFQKADVLIKLLSVVKTEKVNEDSKDIHAIRVVQLPLLSEEQQQKAIDEIFKLTKQS